MSKIDPKHVISIESRHDNPREIKELEAFVAAAEAAELDLFVKRAFYDSKSCVCYFEFRFGLHAGDEHAYQLKEIATQTIGQFDWFGTICHASWLNDD